MKTKQTPLQIIPALPKHAKELSDLRINTIREINKEYTIEQINALYNSNKPQDMLKKIKITHMFIAIKNNQILGTVNIKKNRIGGFYIKHTHIRKGIGKQLLEFIENFAKEKNIKKLHLYSSEYAEPFYKKHKYKSDNKHHNFLIKGVIFPELKMEKTL